MATAKVLYPQDVLAQRLLRSPHAATALVYTHRRKPHPHSHHHTPNPSSTNPSSSSSSSTCRSSIIDNPRLPRKAPPLAADHNRRREGSASPPPPLKAQPQHQHPRVTVLRRGESLDSALAGSSRKQGSSGFITTSARGGDLILPTSSSSSRPSRSQHQHRQPARDDIYAGSAFTVSPAPSALPLPTSFFSAARKDDGACSTAAVLQGSVDHSATKDLLRLLRLQ